MKSRARKSARRFRFRTATSGSCSTALAWRCANVWPLTGLRIRRCNIKRLKPVSEWTPNPRPPDDTSVVQEHRNWFQLQIVLLICSFCERYAKQLKYMREVAREFPEKIGEVSDATLPAETKQRLKEALRQ